jgi:hypothetical protein
MKANKTFKLSKESKMIMASMLPPHSHEFKRAMIQAELAAAIRPKVSKADRKTSDVER